MTDALEAIAPLTGTVTIGGVQHTLHPPKVAAVAAIIRTARPVVERLLDIDDNDTAQLVSVVLDLLGDQSDAVFSAVSLASGIEQAAIEDADLAEFTDLLVEVARINRDFFAHRLRPALERARSEWVQARNESGSGKTASST